jgi:hypothetical protein
VFKSELFKSFSYLSIGLGSLEAFVGGLERVGCLVVVDLKPPPPETLEEMAGAGVALPDFLAPSSFFVVVGANYFLNSPDCPNFPS